jgi:hypothetical protein
MQESEGLHKGNVQMCKYENVQIWAPLIASQNCRAI